MWYTDSVARVFLEGEWTEGAAELSADESHHLLHVLRLQEGDTVQVMNGRGALGKAVLEKVQSKRAIVRVIETSHSLDQSNIRMVFAVPKQNALDFIIHRCTEVGVRGFQPLLTKHSRKPDSFNNERWQKVLREVCKQCEELFLPELAMPMTLDAYLAQTKNTLVLCDEGDRSAHQKIQSTGTIDVLVGAEGGWAVEEIAKLRRQGAISYGLGRNRLRAEMASVAALILLKREIGES